MTPLRLSRGTLHSPNEDSCSQAKLPKTDLSGSLVCFCVHLKCVLWVSVLCENTGSLADSHALLISVPDRILPAAAQQRWPSSEGVNMCPQAGLVAFLTLPDPPGRKGAASVVQLRCFSVPRLCQGLGRGALLPLSPRRLRLGMMPFLAAEPSPCRLSWDLLPSQTQVLAQVGVSV